MGKKILLWKYLLVDINGEIILPPPPKDPDEDPDPIPVPQGDRGARDLNNRMSYGQPILNSDDRFKSAEQEPITSLLFPNPNYGVSNLQLSMEESQIVQISLTDSFGKKLWSKRQQFFKGQNLMQISAPSGIHLVIVQTESYVKTIRMVVVY